MQTLKSFPITSMQKSQEKHSASRSEFWGICCESGKKYSQVVRKKFHLSMAALDPTVSGTSPCVSLMVERGGCQYLLCNLKPDSILQVNLNLFFDMGEKVTFSLKGRGTVHLSGYHIFQEGDHSISNDSSKSPTLSPMKNNSLDSDIAIDEETSEESEEYEDSSDDDNDEEEEVVIKPKKNPALAKVAQKALITTAKKVLTPQGTPNKKDNGSKTDVKQPRKVKLLLKATMKDSNKIFPKRTLEEESSDKNEESSEEEPDNSLDKVPPKQKPKNFQSNKRLKTETSTPVLGKKAGNQNTPKLCTELIDLEDDSLKSTPKSFNKGELNSSIGRTPMPKKPVSLSNAIRNMDKAPVGDDESSGDDSDEMNTSLGNKSMQSSTDQLNVSTESKKKRKKKKKNAAAAANDSKALENTPAKLNESLPAFKSAKKLPGGLEYEDIRVGHGLEAKKGKLVHVYYTGKLENNKVFDSRQPGTKPFSFKLGSGQVIRGWDVGLEGMKVGGKRKLKIPPHMGYKNQRMGDIPPSSTLHFVVELKAVS